MHQRYLIAILALVLGAVAGASAQAPERSIVNITGELYRAQNNNHFTVFLVTPEGIVMSDPINRDFALWLKGEFARRFDTPVRYVLYTHHDWDHASGGVVFADTAQFIGHDNMPEALRLPRGNPPLPGNVRAQDANNNGLIERSEATGNTAAQFDLIDENGDGVLSGAELIRGPLNDVYPPSLTFADRHAVTLGGRTVEMIYLGVAHAEDSTVLYFPAERAVFGADTLQVRRLPGGVGPTVGDWIQAMRLVNALDYEHALTGHALAGTKADIVDLQRYLEDLASGVARGVSAGMTLEQIRNTLALEAYRDWDRYEQLRATHIAQVYATLMGSTE